MKLKKTLSAWLSNRYQLVIRNEEDLEEKSTFSFSYAKLISLGTVLLLILVALSLVLSTTMLARWLNPAYTEQENEKRLIQLATEVDALEQQTSQQKKFIALLQSIIEGKEPPTEELSQPKKQQTEEATVAYTAEQLAEADAHLRSEFENDEPGFLPTYHKPLNGLQELFLCPPVKGIITTPFKQTIRHYGVDIVAKQNSPIKAVADGIVIFSSWTVETGWVIMIQHSNNLVSVYKHNASVLRKVGSFVKRGDVITIIGNSGELSTGPHLHFELWHNGNAINPEYFITF